MKNIFFVLIIFNIMVFPFLVFADSETESKKSTTQQVNGLLFDVDEGVKVEQGPGGSVYMKSNKEYMQDKFKEIDQKFASLENRVANLETEMSKRIKEEKADEPNSQSPTSSVSATGRRVLSS